MRFAKTRGGQSSAAAEWSRYARFRSEKAVQRQSAINPRLVNKCEIHIPLGDEIEPREQDDREHQQWPYGLVMQTSGWRRFL
jgi:hypothetical protein